MGVIGRFNDHRKLLWHRAVFVARTEGMSAMLQHSAQFAGLAKKQSVSWDDLPRDPVPGTVSAGSWPDAVLVVSRQGAEQRVAELASAGVPVLQRTVSDPGLAAAQQLVSVVYVIGSACLTDAVAGTAARLGQRLLLQLEPGDDPGTAPPCDALVVAAGWELPGGTATIVLPGTGDALRAALLGQAR